MKYIRYIAVSLFILLLTAVPAIGENAIFPCPEDISELWDMEDVRSESESDLIAAMYLNGARMGYDRASSTWYASFTPDESGEWPDMTITAEGDSSLQLYWLDEPTWDDAFSAVSRGMRYEFAAFTDSEFREYGVVFSGLPVVVIDTEPGVEIEADYVPAVFSVASSDAEPLETAAVTHLRAGGPLHEYDKLSYRVECRKENGKKRKVSVLNMPEDTDWLLVSNPLDAACVYNYLCRKLWLKWNEGESCLVPLQSRMVELFVQGEYRGMYEMIQRIDPKLELTRMGGDTGRDFVARLIHPANVGEKYPSRWFGGHNISLFELRRTPKGMTEDEAFAFLDDYALLSEAGGLALDDDTFIDLMSRRFDVEELMNFYLYLCAMQLSYDNIENNIYLMVEMRNGEPVYHPAPWDMDRSLGKDEIPNDWSMNLFLEPAVRLLNLNALDSRKILHRLWEEKKQRCMNEDTLRALFAKTEDDINRSGAYLRESALWQGDAIELDLSIPLASTEAQIGLIDDYLSTFWPI